MTTPSNYKEEIRERFLDEMHNHAVANAIGEEALKMYLNHIAAYFLAELDRVVGEERARLREKISGQIQLLAHTTDLNVALEWAEDEIKFGRKLKNKAERVLAYFDILSLLAPSTDKGETNQNPNE